MPMQNHWTSNWVNLSLSLSLSLSLCLLRECPSSDPSNAFQISHADKSFHVFAGSTADKANWLANLTKHISRAAQSGRHPKVAVK